MIINVGIIDRILRLLLGLFLIWIGVFVFNGKEGSLLGIGIAAISLLPFYMTLTGSCFVFNWFKIHSLSKKECEIHGKPYAGKKD